MKTHGEAMSQEELFRRADRLCSAIYERHPAGCCWHVVLDDGNVEDGHVEHCAREVAANSTMRARRIA